MKETTKNIALGLVLLAVLGLGYIYFAKQEVSLGSVISDPSFGASGLTSASTTCGNAQVAQVVAAQSGRTSFAASWTGGNVVYLCRGATSTCAINTGIALATSSPRYEQQDSYVGPYSCISVSASTSIATSNSQ